MIGRQLAFAARMPPRKIAARLALLAKRNLLARAAPLLPAIGLRHAAAPLATTLPAGLIGPGRSLETLGEGRFAFTFIGERREFRLPIDWHLAELKTGTSLWLLNLHYMEYLAEADDEAFAALVLDWIAGNPGYEPAYWTYNWNSYALSIRAVAIMKADRPPPRAAAAGRARRMLRSLTSQIRFLERNLETDLGGNHLIKNIKALVWAGAFFAGPRAARWRALGDRAARRASSTRQILADGMHFERSPSYHAQVFADLLEIPPRAGIGPARRQARRGLARMARAARRSRPSRRRPAAVQRCRADIWPIARSLPRRLRGPCSAGPPRPAGASPFATPAISGRAPAASRSIADMGPIGPDELARARPWRHRQLRTVGRRPAPHRRPGRVRICRGRQAPGRSRSAQRATTASHIAGGDQADFFGAFRCGRRPKVEAEFELGGEDGVPLRGHHDGYAHLPGSAACRTADRGRRGTASRFTTGSPARSGTQASIGLLLHPEVRRRAAPAHVDRQRGGVAARIRGSC